MLHHIRKSCGTLLQDINNDIRHDTLHSCLALLLCFKLRVSSGFHRADFRYCPDDKPGHGNHHKEHAKVGSNASPNGVCVTVDAVAYGHTDGFRGSENTTISGVALHILGNCAEK